MTTLLLLLTGPLQAWGDSSRFTRRSTRLEPTKSGVIGLLAAAQGRRRTDPVEDLAALRFGVRLDQRGRIVRDFHTARSLDGTKSLSTRFYIADATFLAGVEGDGALLEALAEAVQQPRFPLALGRRSCAPSRPVFQALKSDPLEEALRGEGWHASEWYRRQQGKQVYLDLVLDAEPGVPSPETVRDTPLSFDPTRRQYGWRTVARPAPVAIVNDDGRAGMDFLAPTGGA